MSSSVNVSSTGLHQGIIGSRLTDGAETIGTFIDPSSAGAVIGSLQTIMFLPESLSCQQAAR
jgi:hypothetical protein